MYLGTWSNKKLDWEKCFQMLGYRNLSFLPSSFCPGGYLSRRFWLTVPCPVCSIFGVSEALHLHLLKYRQLLSHSVSLLPPSALCCYLNTGFRYYMYQSKFLYSYRIAHELSMIIFQSNLDSEKCFVIFTSLTYEEINLLIKNSFCTFPILWSSLCTLKVFKSSRQLMIKQLP